MPNYLVLVRNPNGTIKRIKRESASKGDRVPNEVHRFDIDADTIPETTIKDKYLDWDGSKFTEVDQATKDAIDAKQASDDEADKTLRSELRNVDPDIKIAITALVKVINKRLLPAQRITDAELFNQIKDDIR